MTDLIYRRYPALSEGQLAKVRAAVVSATPLADLAQGLGVGDALLIGKGEETTGGRSKQSILADAAEAVIGALYLDGGWDAARRFVVDHLGERIADAAREPGEDDYKTRLQEMAARHFDGVPRYRVRSEGPDHEKRFFAVVTVGGHDRGEGEGRSKKEAEQAAARVAWTTLATSAGRLIDVGAS